MNQILKRSFAIAMVVVMLLCALPAVTITSSAASYTYNWGTRGELATELSDAAITWYEKYNTSYAELSALSGSASTNSVPSSALYTELKSLMTSAHSYKTSYEATKELYQYTDCQNGGGKISSFYSGTAIGPGWGEGGSWNREHTWPNSKGLGGQDENDIMMLRPTTTSENSSRGNEAYGESGSYYDPNVESNGKYNLHGDVARIVLYVYVRWGNTSYMWGSSGVMESKEVLLKWMEEDPVDTWELGRNDAVESITGTRNVFVDYPELAFDLFNEDVPAGYDSPSGGTPTYTVTATSNNTSYGTVSVSGSTITATPKTGYYAAGYTVTSGSATVIQSGNTFKVSASSDCTIRINFATKTTVTVSFSGANVAAQSGYAGESMTLPTNVEAPDGFDFLGWTTSALSGDTTEKPMYYTDSFTPTVNTTLYALYSYVDETASGGSGDYVKVTEEPSDWSGEYLVVYESAGYILDGSLSSFDKSGNYQEVSITDNTISAAVGDPYKFTVTAYSTGYSFQGTSGMYFGASSAKNSLNSSATALVNTLSLNSDGSAAIKGTGGYVLRFNTGDKRFRYYNGTQAAIALYVKDGSAGTVYYTTDPVKCDHSNTTNVAAVAATCTETGYSAGVYCNDCDSYISGHEVVAALGHKWGDWAETTAPTCTATGIETRICSVCGERETRSVTATGHSYNGVVTPPTTYEQGYTTYTCSACSHSYVADYVEALGETYIVSFSVPAGVGKVAQMECDKNGITLPSAGVPTGDHKYTFVGWSTERADNVTNMPEIIKAGDTYIATAETTLYAVYTYVVSDGSGVAGAYTLYSGALTEGDYVIVYKGSALVAADADSSGRMDYSTVTVNNNTVENPDATIIWHIASEGTYWTIYNAENGVYAAGTGSKNKSTVISSLTDYGRWTATGDGSYEFKNLGNANKGVNALLRCNGTYGFACYSTSTGGALSLYKGSSGTTYYTTVIGDDPVIEWNVSLSDNIGVNFVTTLTNDDEIGVTVNNEPVSIELVDGKFSIELAAAQMTDEIAITVNDMPLEKTYSVRGYADYILDEANGYNDATKNLVKFMLNYGGAAQTYFGYNTSNMANTDITVDAVNPPAAAETELAVSGSAEGITFYGASLVYRDKIAIRFYFVGDAAEIDGAVVKGDQFYIEVAGILPQDYNKAVTVEVGGLIVSYSPMNYIVRMYNKADAADSTKALVKALYNYYLAAEAYTA